MKIKPYIDLIGSLVTFTSLENLYAYSRMYGLCTHHSYVHLFILNNGVTVDTGFQVAL